MTSMDPNTLRAAVCNVMDEACTGVEDILVSSRSERIDDKGLEVLALEAIALWLGERKRALEAADS